MNLWLMFVYILTPKIVPTGSRGAQLPSCKRAWFGTIVRLILGPNSAPCCIPFDIDFADRFPIYLFETPWERAQDDIEWIWVPVWLRVNSLCVFFCYLLVLLFVFGWSIEENTPAFEVQGGSRNPPKHPKDHPRDHQRTRERSHPRIL